MTTTKRFQLIQLQYKPGLMIEDFIWWMDNEREILNWMVDRLPRGIEHQEGMSLVFDNEQDRIMFLLKWGA